jgi:alkaline phosphatase
MNMNPLAWAAVPAFFAFLALAANPIPACAGDSAPRNVIFMVGDGMSFAHVKAYRMYADDPSTNLVEPLPMEQYLVGAVSTDSIRLDCSSGDCVRLPHGFTDSASSATAYATGYDTIVGHLSVSSEGKPLKTILERAHERGQSTGLVATSEITHATPAAYASHVSDRDQHSLIANQLLDPELHDDPVVDVLLGGGRKHLVRSDRDLLAEFGGSGWEVVQNRNELMASREDQLLGVFADQGLPRAWDRDENTPSLADMTMVALRTLNRNDKGFFLMVEGSQIDWASHKNSVPGVISEMEDFIGAVGAALEFARQHGDTLVVITADHDTGGMGLGRDNIYHWDPASLRGMKHTPKYMAQEFRSSDQSLAAIVARNVPFELTAVEVAELNATHDDDRSVRRTLANLFNSRTFTGWSSDGHTGADVPLYVFGPASDRFGGLMENEDLGRVLQEVFLSRSSGNPDVTRGIGDKSNESAVR